MKQFAVIGLSKFALCMIDELSDIDCEILVIDKDRSVIEKVKDQVTTAYIADVIDEETIRKLVPEEIDAGIVDLGDRLEVSILVTNYLKKMKVKHIVAKAETTEHGEILKIIGADMVIFPNSEAARRVTPILASDLLFNFLSIGSGFVIAEVKVPKELAGKSLIEAGLRSKFGLNVVAVRKYEDASYKFPAPDHTLSVEELMLVAGSENDVTGFSGEDKKGDSHVIGDIIRKLFRR